MTTEFERATAELSENVDTILRLHELASEGVATAERSELRRLMPLSEKISETELDDELRYWATAFDSSIAALYEVRSVLDLGGYTDISAVRRARIPARYVLSMLRERIGELAAQPQFATPPVSASPR